MGILFKWHHNKSGCDDTVMTNKTQGWSLNVLQQKNDRERVEMVASNKNSPVPCPAIFWKIIVCDWKRRQTLPLDFESHHLLFPGILVALSLSGHISCSSLWHDKLKTFWYNYMTMAFLYFLVHVADISSNWHFCHPLFYQW